MNTTTVFYKGLTNDDEMDDLTVNSCTCQTLNGDTLTVNSITASHYYGLLTQLLNASDPSLFNPEMYFGFDISTNTFTIQLYDDAIPL